MSRSERKIDHIRHAISHEREIHNHFDDIEIVHQSLARLNFEDIQMNIQVGELYLSSPLFVNAMTGGGGEETMAINRNLAIAAKETGIGMAVGSQMSALKNVEERKTYEIVREMNPEGVIFANVGSEATLDQAREAVRMLHADALQIHINTLQEMIMPEGDRDFSQRMHRIQDIIDHIDVPVIVKEVGYGMSKETADTLYQMGVRHLDVGGRGGTNFSRVENMRRERAYTSFNNWGIPTPVSVLETSISDDLHVFASGGVRNGLDGAKAMVLGAKGFGMAGSLLKILVNEGREALTEEIHHILHEFKIAMMLQNALHPKKLNGKPHVMLGYTKQWYDQRMN
ncbi:type 2 isopentenyl-diphosphate Delta-isomerase [Halobacillus aidingensis]|uniref:Isopentenyl-diphosphate delta-isomerase n=1 Tax=Halobacillus aidingensis TaxID=240303 RepID=A0A1H0NQD2_HALAD|nr:type 2 isopentenyl-diphosphate Delta-isomerase [Halobacillus aidingensis]SDO94992.1 isopentenyl-diphosphate delta-isomerase [Halobacillus aidingensis]